MVNVNLSLWSSWDVSFVYISYCQLFCKARVFIYYFSDQQKNGSLIFIGILEANHAIKRAFTTFMHQSDVVRSQPEISTPLLEHTASDVASSEA